MLTAAFSEFSLDVSPYFLCYCGVCVADYSVIDLARLIPPVQPRTFSHPRGLVSVYHDLDFMLCVGYLYLQFRPEFMQKHAAGQPLSSDAFSYWGRHDAIAHNARVPGCLCCLTRRSTISSSQSVPHLSVRSGSSESSFQESRPLEGYLFRTGRPWLPCTRRA